VSEITTVIWDIGNVLVRWDPRNLYRNHFSDEDEMEFFLANVTTAEWNLAQDEGRSFAEAVEILSAKFPHYADLIKLYDTNWPETLSGEILESVDMLKAMDARGTVLYALTNFSAEKWPVFKELYEFPRYFKGAIVSGEVGLIKPDPAIYQLTIDRFSLRPEQTLFIDDRPENIVAAEHKKMRGHHFTDPASLETKLKELSLL
jgi:2-haloacid dehalogenase